jgi:hypothetical protein
VAVAAGQQDRFDAVGWCVGESAVADTADWHDALSIPDTAVASVRRGSEYGRRITGQKIVR